jgi:hypothetical protein
MTAMRTTLAAGLALFTLAGGARAADIYPYGGDRYETSRYRDVEEREEVRPRQRFEERYEERVERRSVIEDDEDRYAGRERPWARPVYERRSFAPYDDCRIIVRRKVNYWGDLVVRRVRICR